MRADLRLFLVLAAGVASGCATPTVGASGPADLGEAPALTTDRSTYRITSTATAYELEVRLRYTNPTDSPVYIPTCREPHPPILQKLVQGEWVTAYQPVVLLCLGPPVVIEPGASYEYTYRVHAARGADAYPRFEVEEIPGVYRLEWSILATWAPDGPEPGLGRPLPLELRLSNTFQIEQ